MPIQSPFGFKLIEKINEDYNDKAKALAVGAAENYADYHRRVGVIEGLMRAASFCAEVEQEYLSGKDESSSTDGA
jgi:hypothetical protein